MKQATLTRHAKTRISERCSLSQDEIIGLLDAGAGVPIHLQKGGRYVHRLIYSFRDDGWFMVVQDGRDGGVLTIMPLEYLQGRTEVTATHKRQARRKALDARDSKAVVTKAAAVVTTVQAQPPTAPRSGCRIRVLHHKGGSRGFTMLPRVPADYGSPGEWLRPGPIHQWLRERLIEAGIPFPKVDGLMVVGKKQQIYSMDHLLEHLPLTKEEIDSCR